MKSISWGARMGALAIAAACAVQAAPAMALVVAPGSSYSVYINGDVSGNELNMTNTFDGVTESFTRAGETLFVSETETGIGPGLHRILIQLDATGDLFPAPGEAGLMGIGIDGNGLDFVNNVFLEDAFIRVSIDGATVFSTVDLADAFRPLFLGAWDGKFADTGLPFSIGGLGGANVNGLALEFIVSDLPATVPEPGSVALVGAALLVMGAARRRPVSAGKRR